MPSMGLTKTHLLTLSSTSAAHHATQPCFALPPAPLQSCGTPHGSSSPSSPSPATRWGLSLEAEIKRLMTHYDTPSEVLLPPLCNGQGGSP